MEFIAHRVNKISELIELKTEYGVEIDLRDGLDGRVYLEHDPFTGGDDFEEYLKHYRHGTMILNIKSERIEHKVLEFLQQYGITRYFFLDSSFPMIKLLSDSGEKNIALRFSEFEGMDTIRAMAGQAQWVWVDCFTCFPLTRQLYNELCSLGYKICIVSPELQGQPERIDEFEEIMVAEGIVPDAVCTKMRFVDKWKNIQL